MSEFEQHESSYDHHHRKRAADLRMANKDPGRRRDVEKDSALIPLGDDSGSRKPVKKVKRAFKAAFGHSIVATEGRKELSRTPAKRHMSDTSYPTVSSHHRKIEESQGSKAPRPTEDCRGRLPRPSDDQEMLRPERSESSAVTDKANIAMQ